MTGILPVYPTRRTRVYAYVWEALLPRVMVAGYPSVGSNREAVDPTSPTSARHGAGSAPLALKPTNGLAVEDDDHGTQPLRCRRTCPSPHSFAVFLIIHRTVASRINPTPAPPTPTTIRHISVPTTNNTNSKL